MFSCGIAYTAYSLARVNYLRKCVSTCRWLSTTTLRLWVTNSGRGNSANSPVNNFGVHTYTTINSAGALLRKDS